MTNSTLLNKVEKTATDILKKLPTDLVFHNYERTKSFVEASLTIGSAEKLDEEALEIVQIAAWFQHTGFSKSYHRQAEESQQIATTFLKAENVATDKIERILSCMRSIKSREQPANKLEEVLQDASNNHWIKGNYKAYLNERRTELAEVGKKKFTDIEWLQLTLEQVTKTKIYTTYGKEHLTTEKEAVRLKLEKNLNKLQKKIDEHLVNQLGVTTEELKALKKKLKKAEGRPERGIETMFRLTSKNHIDLSGMADTKANIMISVNSIIISILLGGLMQKLDTNPHLVVPTLILLMVNLASMIFAILSIRPNITKGMFTEEDIQNQRTNLLFFGNFHKMKREDYHWGMNQLMENASFLYSSLIDDIYFLGVVLAKKYRLLRWSYNIFMVGIVIAVLAYVIANFLAEQPAKMDVLLK